jgi:hypothetical protein
MATIDFTPAQVDIVAYAGDDQTFTVTVLIDGAPADVTGTNTAQIKALAEDAVALATMAVTPSGTPGEVTITLTAEDSALLADLQSGAGARASVHVAAAAAGDFVGVWDWQNGDPATDDVRTYCRGTITVSDDVTRLP